MYADFRQVIRDFRALVSDLYQSQKSYLRLLAGIVLGFIAALACIGVFYEILAALNADELGHFDDRIILFIYGFRSDVLTDILLFITELGDRTGYLLAGIALLVFFYFRYRSFIFPLQTGMVLLVAGGLNRWLKALINRPRPDADRLMEAHGLSFPSGHAMSSIAFYGFLIYLTWRLTPKNPVLRWVLTLVLVLLILAIGLSRVYLGVHYPSDVVAGYLAGAACLAVFISIFSYVRYRYARRGIDKRVTSKEQQPIS